MSGRLVHVGSAMVDYVYRIDALPAPGGEDCVSFAQVAGGGFNMMVAARRTGMKVVFGGQLGGGPNGDFLRAAFMAGASGTDAAMRLMDSGNCVALISSDAERLTSCRGPAPSVLSLDDGAGIRRAGDWCSLPAIR
jgi:sugar/nucleoside kinase (ribokinase family)